MTIIQIHTPNGAFFEIKIFSTDHGWLYRLRYAFRRYGRLNYATNGRWYVPRGQQRYSPTRHDALCAAASKLECMTQRTRRKNKSERILAQCDDILIWCGMTQRQLLLF